MTIREVIDLTRAMGISGVPVVSEKQTVGIVTGRDLRFETQLDAPVSSVMTPQERLTASYQPPQFFLIPASEYNFNVRLEDSKETISDQERISIAFDFSPA